MENHHHKPHLSVIASSDPENPFTFISRRAIVPSAVRTVKVVHKKKGVKTTKIKTVFEPSYDILNIRLGQGKNVWCGNFSFKVHNISRQKATKSAKDDTWSPDMFNNTLQDAIQ